MGPAPTGPSAVAARERLRRVPRLQVVMRKATAYKGMPTAQVRSQSHCGHWASPPGPIAISARRHFGWPSAMLVGDRFDVTLTVPLIATTPIPSRTAAAAPPLPAGSLQWQPRQDRHAVHRDHPRVRAARCTSPPARTPSRTRTHAPTRPHALGDCRRSVRRRTADGPGAVKVNSPKSKMARWLKRILSMYHRHPLPRPRPPLKDTPSRTRGRASSLAGTTPACKQHTV